MATGLVAMRRPVRRRGRRISPASHAHDRAAARLDPEPDGDFPSLPDAVVIRGWHLIYRRGDEAEALSPCRAAIP